MSVLLHAPGGSLRDGDGTGKIAGSAALRLIAQTDRDLTAKNSGLMPRGAGKADA